MGDGHQSDSRLGQILMSNLGRSSSNWSDHMTESESGSESLDTSLADHIYLREKGGELSLIHI